MTLHMAVFALISRGLYTLKTETFFYFASKWQLLFKHGCIIYNNYTEGQTRIFWDYSFHVKFDVCVCVCVCVHVCAQSCLSLCDPIDCSPPGSSVLGILQARRQEWVTISFSRGSFQLRDGTLCHQGSPSKPVTHTLRASLSWTTEVWLTKGPSVAAIHTAHWVWNLTNHTQVWEEETFVSQRLVT